MKNEDMQIIKKMFKYGVLEGIKQIFPSSIRVTCVSYRLESLLTDYRMKLKKAVQTYHGGRLEE